MKKCSVLLLIATLLLLPSICSAKWVYSNETATHESLYYEDSFLRVERGDRVLFYTWLRIKPPGKGPMYEGYLKLDLDTMHYMVIEHYSTENGKSTPMPTSNEWEILKSNTSLDVFFMNATGEYIERVRLGKQKQ